MEKLDLFAKELEGIRDIARSFTLDEEPAPNSEELVLVRVDELITRLERNLRDRQLNLDPNAIIYMDHFQSEMCQLLEDCNRYLLLRKDSVTKPKRRSLYTLIIAIDTFLEHLRNDFSHCFNFRMKVPPSLKTRLNLNLARDWNKLVANLKKVGVEDVAIGLLSLYHQEMLLEKRPNFYEIDFWSSFIYRLSNADCNSVVDAEQWLLGHLCYLNFNYPPILQFYIRKIQRNYDLVDDYREEYIKIIIQIRNINHLVVGSKHGYQAGAALLTEVLSEALEKELLCVKKLLNLNSKILSGNGAKFFLHQFYFRITISMEQFLFIFRLMIDRGIVIVKRKADLFEFIHSHVGTTHKDHLSVGNMQNTYAENNRKTAIKVRAVLQSLITQIDEKYLSLYFIISVL